MKYWWKRNSSMDLGGHTKNEVEDITGSVPLLLDGCVVDGKIDLSAPALVNVSKQVIEFVGEQHKKLPQDWDA